MRGQRKKTLPANPRALDKVATGIAGLDELTGGGLPRGRTTLVCGDAGCGKTLLGTEFLVRGITEFDEPGVALLFEETEEELASNVASLGFDIQRLVADKKLFVDHVRVERSEIEETGEYNLDGLFVRIQHAVESVNARRILLDTLESLFSGLSDASVLRAELRRLFRWLKDRGLTAIVTGERGDGSLTRQGLEEYVSDCVILLDNRMEGQAATRRLRVVKYRGTSHGSNEYPFLIDEHGISVLPITSIGLKHVASRDRISSGIAGLDEMLDGEGYYRGASVLVSGPAGAGKTSLGASLASAACRAGERSLMFSFEESPSQLLRNMRSVGVELQPFIDKGLLRVVANRPSLFGLEMHLVSMHKTIEEFEPRVVIIDPITDLVRIGSGIEVHSMLTRLIDFLKAKSITALLTSLTGGGEAGPDSEVGISSLIDTWVAVQSIEAAGERNRGLSIYKSRGMPHSNQIREFVMSHRGIELIPVYQTDEGILTGTRRRVRELHDREQAAERHQHLDLKREELERRRRVVEAEIDSLRADLAAREREVERLDAMGNGTTGRGNGSAARGNGDANAKSRRAR